MPAPLKSKVTSLRFLFREAYDYGGQARSKTILYKIFKLLIDYPFCRILMSLSILFIFLFFSVKSTVTCSLKAIYLN